MKFEYLRYALMVDNHMSKKEELKMTSLYLLSISALAFVILGIVDI